MLRDVPASAERFESVDIVGVLVGIDVQRCDVMHFQPSRATASPAAVTITRETRLTSSLPAALVKRRMVTAAWMRSAHPAKP